MGTGYTRNDTSNNIASGNVVTAADFDGEYDAIEAAFNATTGHTHDGTTSEGAPITQLGPAQDFIATATEIKGKSTNTLDIGTSGVQFKNMYLDGLAYIDGFGESTIFATTTKVQFRDTGLYINSSVDGQLDIVGDIEVQVAAPTIDLNASTAATLDTALFTLTATTLDINAATAVTIDTANITVTGAVALVGAVNVTGDLDVDNLTLNGNTIVSSNTNGDINLTPNGTGTVVISKTDINDGTLDSVVIGGASAAAATVTDLTASGTVTFTGATVANGGAVTTVDINGGTIDGSVIGSASAAAGTFTNITGTSLQLSDTTSSLSITSTDPAASGPTLYLTHNSATPADGDEIGEIYFRGVDSVGTTTAYARIRGLSYDVTDGAEDGALVFYNMTDGVEAINLRITNGGVRLAHLGNTKLETSATGVDVTGRLTTSAAGLNLFMEGADDTASGPYMQFYHNRPTAFDSDEVGEILFTGKNSVGAAPYYARLRAFSSDVTDGSEDGALFFYAYSAGTDYVTMRLESGGVTLAHLGTTKLVTSATGVTVTGEVAATTVNATTVDTTNIEVTTLKAKDGSSAGSIADTTGIVTLASSVLTTADINGGTADAVVIGGASAAAATFTNLTASGTITFTGATVANGGAVTTVDINGGTIDGAVIGGASAAAITGTTVNGTTITASAGFVGDGSGLTGLAASGIGSVVEDTTPQLGGTLDANGNNIQLDDNGIVAFGTAQDAEFFTNGVDFYLDLNAGINNFIIRDATTTRFTFDDAGDFTATGDVTAYSDRSLKDDVRPITDALDKVDQINGVTFVRNDMDSGARKTGVIAQDVEAVLPEVVSTDENGIKSVAYGNMVGLLIEAVKELRKEVKTLKGEAS